MASPIFSKIPSAPSPNLFAAHAAPNAAVADAPQAFSNMLEQGIRQHERAAAPDPRESASSTERTSPPTRTPSNAPAREPQGAQEGVTGHTPGAPTAGPEASSAGTGLERPGRLIPVPGSTAPESSDAPQTVAAVDPASLLADTQITESAVPVLAAPEAAATAAALVVGSDSLPDPATLLEPEGDPEPLQEALLIAAPLATEELVPLPDPDLEPAPPHQDALPAVPTDALVAPGLPATPASLAAIAPILAALGLTPALQDAASAEQGLPAATPRTPLDAMLARLFGNLPAAALPVATTPGEAGTRTVLQLAPQIPGGRNPIRLPLAEPGLPWVPASPGDAASAASASGRFTNTPAVAVQTPAFVQNATLAAQPVGSAEPAANTPLIPALSAALRAEPALLPQLPVATPAGQRLWAEDVGARMIWMVGRNESRAELLLTPASLGKVSVSLQFSGDQASAHFVAATPAAREVLEQAMPRLREVMQQAGIQLGQANVSTAGEHQAREQAGAHRSPLASGLSHETIEGDRMSAAPVAAHWLRGATGIIDIFA